MMNETMPDERIKDAVRDKYGSVARRFVSEPAGERQASCCGPAQPAQSSCCGPAQQADSSCCSPEQAADAADAANRFYTEEELAVLPESVTGASLGCGNPLAIAGLRPGEVVLDLGSGGGIDCFLAARQVGPEGRVIGLDMTPDMIKLARRNAKEMGVTNVDFRYGEMEEMPLPDNSVDVIISNCVINLSPDKDAVFGETYRVLQPGGRFSVSDIVVDGDLPQFIRARLDAWAGCVAGALDEGVYLDKIRAAGFEQVEVLSRDTSYLGDGDGWDEVQALAAGEDVEVVKEKLDEAGLTPSDLVSKVASIKVQAYKPA